jgi:hypothetical protein
LTDAEKGQSELRKVLAAKEAELAAARAEVVEERRRCANTDHLGEELRVAQVDVKSLKRHNGILRADIEEARYNEKQMSGVFEVMKSELDKNKEQ